MLNVRAVQYLIVIALWLASLVAPRRAGTIELEGQRGTVPLLLILPPLAGLAAAAIAQLHVIDLAARQQVPMPAWRAALPLIPIDDKAPLFGHTAPWIGESSGALALLQALLLAALYLLMRRRALSRLGWLCVAATGALMALAALFATGLTSSDIYLYAGHGRLGLDAYAPPGTRFPGEFGAINDLRGVPIYPSLYGPVWLAIASAVSHLLPRLAAQLFAFRLLGLGFIILCAVLLAIMQRPPAIVALFALNPALYEQFVSDAHNDALPLALVLAAFAVMALRPWLGWLLVVAAGTTKLPFAIAGLTVFSTLLGRTQRLVLGASAVAASLLLTFVASGGQYFETTARMSARISRAPLIVVPHDVAIALVIVGAFAALAFGIYLAGASWSFVSLSTTLFPWYVAWSVPYALAEETMLPVFLCTLPVATFLLSSVYAPTLVSSTLFALAIVSPLLLAMRARRAASR